jgi:hypothetical protein
MTMTMTMNFDIRPYEGAGPVTFAMNREEIHAVLGLPNVGRVKPDGTLVEWWDDFAIRYERDTRRMCEMEFTDRFAVHLDGIDLFHDPEALSKLVMADGAPMQGMGAIIFLNLGISTRPPLASPEDAGRTVCIFLRGTWDDVLHRLVPYEEQPLSAGISA